MKRFVSISACVASLSILLVMAHDQALTAKNFQTTLANQPLKVLGVKVNPSDSQLIARSEKVNWLDDLEVQIQNTSGKAIKYLVINVEVSVNPSDNGNPLRVPFKYGQAPVETIPAKSEMFQPGAKLTLSASESVCDSLRNQVLESAGRAPASSKDIQTNIHVVIFEDKTAWMAGQLHYPDPANPMKWIAAAELSKNNVLGQFLPISYSRVSYNSVARPTPCFRFTGVQLQACCEDLYVAEAVFTGDPNGTVQPKPAEACCQGGGCCLYDEVGSCP